MTRQLIAILRGLEPEQSASVAECLVAEGFGIIEVPLNSPSPFESIRILAREFGRDAVVGAGTVLAPADVRRAAECGSKIIVSPNTNPEVIAETKKLGMESWPGALTPTECFTALACGADGLKIFPAGLVGTEGVAAIRAVLPADCRLFAVGGIGPGQFASWQQCGISGFGLGSSLFAPGMLLPEIRRRARHVVDAYDAAFRPPCR